MPTLTQDDTIAHPAFAESAAHLAELLRGLVIRWETLDFTAPAECFSLEGRLRAWKEAGSTVEADLPRAYERN